MSYHPDTLIPGYKISMKSENMYVAIPNKEWNNGFVAVTYDDRSRIFRSQDIVKELSFKDKYGREDYILKYVLWNGEENDRIEQPKLV